MKIGILTLPIAENYGGILQALALSKYLENQGHTVSIIYKSYHQEIWKKLVLKILLKIPFHDIKKLKTLENEKKKRFLRKDFHRSFINNEFKDISYELYTKEDLEKYIDKKQFDTIIVGSDQVWRKTYINDKYYKSYFLDFINDKKIKKISYAASFGTNHWEGINDEKDISILLNSFNSISVREDSAIDICKTSFKYNNAELVVDPTLLLSKDFYIKNLIKKYNHCDSKAINILTYVLDKANEKKVIIDYIKMLKKTNNIKHLKGFNESKKIISVPEWLSSFSKADFIITDSFHGMVFSIIFKKQFIVVGNKKRGIDRFTSLLKKLNLENRLVFDINDLKNKSIDNIDYYIVDKTLNLMIDKSSKFLTNALKRN